MASYSLDLKYISSRYKNYGDYFVKEQFNVSHINSTQPINGWIVQYITKQPDIETTTGFKLNDTDSIMQFTEGQVEFMSDNYLELFKVENGKAIIPDQFASGPIAKYEYDTKKNKWYTTDDVLTKGSITHTGLSVFIPKTPNQTDLEQLYTWNTSRDTPAGGLPFISCVQSCPKDELFKLGKSNILQHTVTVSWDYNGIPTFNNNKISITSGPLFEGGDKKTRKTCKTRKNCKTRKTCKRRKGRKTRKTRKKKYN